MRRAFLVSAVLLGATGPTSANPVYPGPGEYFDGAIWILTSLPVNYSVDLIVLAVALWITGQVIGSDWKFLPVYAIPVCLAGYVADFCTGLWAPVWQNNHFLAVVAAPLIPA